MIKELILIIILLLSVPTGYLLAWLCRDELVDGRKWFRIIMLVSVIAGIVFLSVGEYVSALAMLFILVCTLISLEKSFDKKWTKIR